MIEMKATELIGSALDWAVAKALGWVSYPTDSIEQGDTWHMNPGTAPFGPVMKVADWRPSTDWSQGGPLIEKYRMHICPIVYDGMGMTQCWIDGCDNRFIDSTPLIAAMRCLVDAKLGDTVQIPSELIQ